MTKRRACQIGNARQTGRTFACKGLNGEGKASIKVSNRGFFVTIRAKGWPHLTLKQTVKLIEHLDWCTEQAAIREAEHYGPDVKGIEAMTRDIREANRAIKELERLSHGTAGLIVAYVVNGKPTWYWMDLGAYRFDDETVSESPQLFKTIEGAARRAAKLNADDWIDKFFTGTEEGGEWVPCLWSHPEMYDLPLDRYMKMTGIPYTGSPRQ